MSHAFASITALARLFAGWPRPWYVAGGWAIDLFVGHVTREHEDMEVAILREDQVELQRFLAGWELVKNPHGTSNWIGWRSGERLESPDFQLRARRTDGDPAVFPAGFDVFLDDAPDGLWRFRRDPRISRPVEEIVIRSAIAGISAVAPELALLYKAKYHRPKDEHDFQQAFPHLGAEQCAWLRAALRIHRPNDPWLVELEGLEGR